MKVQHCITPVLDGIYPLIAVIERFDNLMMRPEL